MQELNEIEINAVSGGIHTPPEGYEETSTPGLYKRPGGGPPVYLLDL